MVSKYEMFAVKVVGVEQETPLIKRFTLVREDGQALPAFTGGSHIIVQMQGADGSRFSNAYSLMGDPSDTGQYQIGVRLEDQSKGGSAFMHHQVQVGSVLTVSSPNNLFALDRAASRHVLIAGGIGITPFLAQLNELRVGTAEYELHYAFRSPEHGAFCTQLMDGPHAARTQLYITGEGRVLDVKGLVAGLDDTAHVYVCGPRRLIDAVIDAARQLGIDEYRVHWEQFAATPASAQGGFSVTLARSGRELWVEEGMSILKAIENAKAAAVECLCREGVCGTCETSILQGEAEHLDQYLNDDEKAAQKTMMICVSRAKGASLVLDL
jgi:ferredoxin-NADP reductase